MSVLRYQGPRQKLKIQAATTDAVRARTIWRNAAAARIGSLFTIADARTMLCCGSPSVEA